MARSRGKEGDRRTTSDTQSPQINELFTHFLKLMKDQGMSFDQLSQLYHAEEQSVPVEIFAKKLSPSEAVCKFIKENRKKSFHEIAVLLDRDDRSIWTSYQRALQKQKSPLVISNPSPSIPLSVLANRKFSFLESVILHLSKQGMKQTAIAKLLHRAAPIIYTVLGRARNKEEKNKQKKEGT